MLAKFERDFTLLGEFEPDYYIGGNRLFMVEAKSSYGSVSRFCVAIEQFKNGILFYLYTNDNLERHFDMAESEAAQVVRLFGLPDFSLTRESFCNADNAENDKGSHWWALAA